MIDTKVDNVMISMDKIYTDKKYYADYLSEGDKNLKNVLYKLWNLQIETKASCKGHKSSKPYIILICNYHNKSYIARLVTYLINIRDIQVSLYNLDGRLYIHITSMNRDLFSIIDEGLNNFDTCYFNYMVLKLLNMFYDYYQGYFKCYIYTNPETNEINITYEIFKNKLRRKLKVTDVELISYTNKYEIYTSILYLNSYLKYNYTKLTDRKIKKLFNKNLFNILRGNEI